jgi:ABC-type multidrug transport system fused ATPase/permease subunit
VIRGHRRALARVAAASFLGGVAEAVFLVSITRIALAVTDHRDQVTMFAGWSLRLRGALLLPLAVVFVRIALAAYASWESANLSAKVVAELRHRLARAFLESTWVVQQEQRAGSLQELLTSYSYQANGLMSNVSQGVVAGANFIALLAMAIGVDPGGALVLVASVSALGLVLRPLRHAVRRRARVSADAGMEFAIGVNEVAELGLELHVFHVQRQARDQVGDLIERARAASKRVQFMVGISGPVYSGLAYIAVLGALAIVVESNVASLASLGAAMLVMLRSVSYGQNLQGAYIGVAGAAPSIEELRQRLDLFEGSRRFDGGQPIGEAGPISAHGVTFAYEPGRTVLRDVSFTIAPKEVIGIVGPSGSGKSTLVQLLLGLRDPDAGRILAGGRDISTLDRAEWARKVTFVPQAPHVIAGTIADNIRFLRDGITDAEIERAARLAHLHDDIMGFPEGYDRQVGDHGGHLSGGQQQRLCIARALVEHPDVLILDEPTSALDVRSEHLIRATLQSLKDRMAVIVIAHRLSTLTICDRIMVIKDGELKDFDTPFALEQSSDFYREALALSGMR